MGSRYTSQSASGYNSSAPADDGSQTASNLVTWAGVKTKLADPVKTLSDAVNTALLTAFDYSVRQITGSDSIAASDHMRTVEIAASVSSTAVSVTLADAATMTSNFIVRIRNSSIINQTIARATGADTIDGTAANITLPPKASIVLSTTAAADGYLTLSYTGPKLDTDPLVTGSSDGTKKVRLEVDGLTTATTRTLTPMDASYTIGDRITIGTEVSASGTSIDFTGIASGVRRITIMFVNISTNGTSNYLVQIGDSGGIENSGYAGAGAYTGSATGGANSTAGFIIPVGSASDVLHGSIVLTLEDASDFTWTAQGSLGSSFQALVFSTGGSKALSAELDRVRITTVNGTDAFDAGGINIQYQR